MSPPTGGQGENAFPTGPWHALSEEDVVRSLASPDG